MKLRARKLPEHNRWLWTCGLAYGVNLALALMLRVIRDGNHDHWEDVINEVIDRIAIRLFPGRLYVTDDKLDPDNLSDFGENLDDIDRI